MLNILKPKNDKMENMLFRQTNRISTIIEETKKLNLTKQIRSNLKHFEGTKEEKENIKQKLKEYSKNQKQVMVKLPSLRIEQKTQLKLKKQILEAQKEKN